MIRKLHLNESEDYTNESYLNEDSIDDILPDRTYVIPDVPEDFLYDVIEYGKSVGLKQNQFSYDGDAEELVITYSGYDRTGYEKCVDVRNWLLDLMEEEGYQYDECVVAESSDWRTNPNRLNDVEDVFVNDIFVNKRGNRVKVLKVNKDDFTIKNIDTGVTSRIRKDYLINKFELADDFAECFPCKTSYVNEKISDKDYSQSKKGIAYKVFEFKNGKLYPPMVANAGNSATPTGVWLDAEPGEFVEIDGLQRVVQRGAKGDKLRQRIANLDKLDPEERKKEVKRIKGSTLAYRPGWHLGDEPRAAQFDREASWEVLDELPEGVKISGNVTNEDTLAKKSTPGNIGKYFYIKSTGQYAHIIGGNGQVFFPYDFVWAECEYVADIDYQDEAMSYGYKKGKKFQHSLAGLPKVPEDGSYKYRTNPRPDTVPWVITGAIKVTKLLDDYDVQQILGSSAPERQGGDKTLAEMGLKQI